MTGTDISLSALNKAREGVYGARRLEHLEGDMGERYFQPLGDGRFKVVESLAARVCCAGSMCWNWRRRQCPAWT